MLEFAIVGLIHQLFSAHGNFIELTYAIVIEVVMVLWYKIYAIQCAWLVLILFLERIQTIEAFSCIKDVHHAFFPVTELVIHFESLKSYVAFLVLVNSELFNLLSA